MDYLCHADPELGWILLAHTPQGICFLNIGPSEAALLAELQTQFPDAVLQENKSLLATLTAIMTKGESDLPLALNGTPFQQAVWQALRTIPKGETRSYQAIAAQINHPKAVRAVGSAVGKNPIIWLIPCHRVISKSGKLGGFRCGLVIKKALLGREGVFF